MTEEWRDIPGQPGYQISNLGRLKSFKRSKKGRLMKTQLDVKGYPTLQLTQNGVCTTHRIHHLVLYAFVGPRPDGMWCLHADDVKTNNCLTNLSYGTPSVNQFQSWSNGCNNGRRIFSPTQVRYIRSSPKRNCELAEEFECDRATISNCRRGISYLSE